MEKWIRMDQEDLEPGYLDLLDVDDCGEFEVKNPELAAALGWAVNDDGRVPTDDNNDPYKIVGLEVGINGGVAVVVSRSQNLAINHDYTYHTRIVVPAETFVQVFRGIKEALDKKNKEEAEAAKCRAVLTSHGLDGETLRLAREEVLRKAGL